MLVYKYGHSCGDCVFVSSSWLTTHGEFLWSGVANIWMIRTTINLGGGNYLSFKNINQIVTGL